jgi:hypothetical protein
MTHKRHAARGLDSFTASDDRDCMVPCRLMSCNTLTRALVVAVLVSHLVVPRHSSRAEAAASGSDVPKTLSPEATSALAALYSPVALSSGAGLAACRVAGGAPESYNFCRGRYVSSLSDVRGCCCGQLIHCYTLLWPAHALLHTGLPAHALLHAVVAGPCIATHWFASPCIATHWFASPCIDTHWFASPCIATLVCQPMRCYTLL